MISQTSTGRVIKETTGATWNVFSEKGYLQPPQSTKDLENIDGLKTDGTSPTVLVHWTENMLLYRRMQRVNLFFLIIKRALVEFYLVFAMLLINYYGRYWRVI